MIKKVHLAIFVAILLVGFLLRVWQVGALPPTLNRDEAALAYNALLLKESGKDEWQRPWPLSLESFGDYKLPGYPYTLVGFFSIFGVNDFVVRLPSVLAGTLLILVTWFLAKKILELSDAVSLMVCSLVALQPVMIFFSRMAWEANLALCLWVTAIILLFSQLKRHRIVADSVAIFLLILAIFTYNTPLLLLPFLLPALVLWRGWKNWRAWILPSIGMLIVLIIGVSALLGLTKQKSSITIFSSGLYWDRFVEYRQQFSGLSQKVVGNRVVFFSRVIFENSLATLSPHFMVLQGGSHPWQTVPGWGHVYVLTYGLGWLGVLAAFSQVFHWMKNRQTKFPRQVVLVLYLLVIAPLPAVVTVDAPHATRSLFFFFVWMLCAGIGVQQLLAHLQKNTRQLLWLALGLVLIFESMLYASRVFLQYPTQSITILRAGFAAPLQTLHNNSSLEHVAIIDEDGYQYILAAWYLKLPAAQFFATIQRHLPDRIGFRYGYKVDKFRYIFAPRDRFPDEQILLYWDAETEKWVTSQKE